MSCDFIFVHDAKFLIKYIFAFHIIKNNYFFFSPDSNLLSASIPIRFLHHLNWDWDGSPPLLRTARLPVHPPDLVIPLAASNVIPTRSPAVSIHQLHQMPDPIVPISNSILIAFSIKEFLPMIAGYDDR